MNSSPFEIVVIGVSHGGLSALESLFSDLPGDFSVPMAIVQHRSAESQGGRLSAMLQRYTGLRVREPHDKEQIRPGHIYLAPPDYHLLIEEDCFALSTEAPVCYARPSIDVLFESAAEAYAQRAIAVVLTGANQDGAAGAAAIKARGGILLVQDPADAECPVMPQAALERTCPDRVLPLHRIVSALTELCIPSALANQPVLK